jgi:hypothetical protein
MIVREIWRFVHPRKIIFTKGSARGEWLGEQIFISPEHSCHKLFIIPNQNKVHHRFTSCNAWTTFLLSHKTFCHIHFWSNSMWIFWNNSLLVSLVRMKASNGMDWLWRHNKTAYTLKTPDIGGTRWSRDLLGQSDTLILKILYTRYNKY